MKSKDISKIFPPELKILLQHFRESDRLKIEAMFNTILKAAQQVQVIDIWKQLELAVTYWILMLRGVNQEEEINIAKDLLIWKAFFSKDSAQVLCIQSSERKKFRCCSSNFGIVNCPTLIFSDNPEMKNFIKIESQLLFALANKRGGLQQFLTKIHSLIENDKSLRDVKSELRNELFWSGLKLIYSEIKGFVFFSA